MNKLLKPAFAVALSLSFIIPGISSANEVVYKGLTRAAAERVCEDHAYYFIKQGHTITHMRVIPKDNYYMCFINYT